MEKWCVVTGGRGFAARHLVEMLIRSEKWWVRIADLGPTIKLEPEEEEGVFGEALRSGRAAYVSADLRNPFQVVKGGIFNLFFWFIIGDGNNLYDFTYVENVAYGHVCAERTLASGGPRAEKAAGQAYFITNNEPIKFWEFVSLIVEGLGYERPSIKIPVSVMMPIAHLVEFTYKLLSPYGMCVPQLTPSRIRLLTCNRTFSCTKARVQLDYEPIVPLKEG